MAKKTTVYKKYVVKITQSAENDLNEIINFIFQNNPRTALVIMEKIISKINSLEHFPTRGGYVPELLARNIKDFRKITEAPWNIYYKINDNIANVLAIIDSRRNLRDVLVNKLLRDDVARFV